jgi:hypothetical protein
MSSSSGFLKVNFNVAITMMRMEQYYYYYYYFMMGNSLTDDWHISSIVKDIIHRQLFLFPSWELKKISKSKPPTC